jgi:hypothetical protein
MPTYCYTCKACKRTLEKYYSPETERRPKSVRCSCGKRAVRDMVAELRPVVHHPGNWPRLSDALGVMPGQQAEAQAQAKRAGVSLDFHADGRAIVRSPQHQRRLVKALGWVDRGAYS